MIYRRVMDRIHQQGNIYYDLAAKKAYLDHPVGDIPLVGRHDAYMILAVLASNLRNGKDTPLPLRWLCEVRS